MSKKTQNDIKTVFDEYERRGKLTTADRRSGRTPCWAAMTSPGCDYWGVLIDTDSYAGNFERELCVHITGVIGECGVGEEFVNQQTFPADVLQIADEHGCSRPCTLWHTSDKKPHSVLIYLSDEPTPEVIAIVKDRAKTFRQRWQSVRPNWNLELREILGFRVIRFEVRETVNVV